MLLGILAVIQAVLLPGLLVLELTKTRTGSLIERLVLAFALSQLVNYLFAFLMVALGLQSRLAVALFVGAEIAVGTWLLVVRWRAGRRSFLVKLRLPVRALTLSSGVAWASAAALAAATGVGLWAGLRFNAFDGWDVLFSWNRWAYAWASGEFPKVTGLYPQLMPANWSMMYLLMGNPEWHLFPIFVMPLFGVAILAMLFDLAVRRRRIEYSLALFVVLGIAVYLRPLLFAPGENAFRGYADLPLTFMMVAAFYVLELRDDRRPADWRALAMPLALACAASVTKANGLWAVGIVLVLALAGHLARRRELSVQDWLKSVATAAAAVLLIPGAWAAVKVVNFAQATDAPYFSVYPTTSASAAGGSGLWARLAGAAKHFVSVRPPGVWYAVVVFCVVGLALALFVRRSRWVVLGVIVPYTALWAYFLSYDLRNWFAMIPVVAFAVAFGYGGLMRRVLHTDMRLKTTRPRLVMGPRVAAALTVVALLPAIALAVIYSPAQLTTAELAAQAKVGSPGLDAALYAAVAAQGGAAGDLLTDYPFLAFLPGFRSAPERLDTKFGTEVSYKYFKEMTVADIAGRDYLMLSDANPPAVNEAVDRGIADGRYTLLAEYDSKAFMSYSNRVTFRFVRVGR